MENGYKVEQQLDSEKLSAPMMMSHPPQAIIVNQQCCAHSAAAAPVKVQGTDNGFPLNLSAVTKVVSFMMCATLLGCGYLKCTDGSFECTNGKFPDISHVMGHPPLNKLYAIMLTLYAANKQAYVRAQHARLQGIASACTLQAMLIYGAMSCIFGPMIGFFDVYYDMHVHCFVVALFVIGEVLYFFTATGVLNSCRTAFPQAAQSSIDTLVTCRALTVVLGVITLGSKVIGKDIDPYGAYIEWILFNMSFYLFTVLADIMPYDAIVVPEDEKDE